MRIKKGTEIPVRVESPSADLRPRYHLKAGRGGSSRTQVKAWAIWELFDVPPAAGEDPVALVVGM